MEIDKTSLEQTYRNKSDDQLLELHATGGLTETACDVLETELRGRGLVYEERARVAVDAAKEYKPSPWWRLLHLLGGLCAWLFVDMTRLSKAVTIIMYDYLLAPLGVSIHSGLWAFQVIGAVRAFLELGSFMIGYGISRDILKMIDTSTLTLVTKVIIKAVLPFLYIVLTILVGALFVSRY